MWNKLIFWTHIFCTSVAHHSAGRIHPAVRCTLRCHQTWQGKSTVTCHGGGFTWESSRTCKQSSIIWLMILVEYKNHIKSMIIKSLNHPTKWWLIFFQQTTQFLDIHGAWDSSVFITTCIIRFGQRALQLGLLFAVPTNGSVNPENEDVNHKKCIEAYTSNVKSTSSMVKSWFHPITSFFYNSLIIYNNT